MTELVATYVVASQPPERRPTATPTLMPKWSNKRINGNLISFQNCYEREDEILLMLTSSRLPVLLCFIDRMCPHAIVILSVRYSKLH